MILYIRRTHESLLSRTSFPLFDPWRIVASDIAYLLFMLLHYLPYFFPYFL